MKKCRMVSTPSLVTAYLDTLERYVKRKNLQVISLSLYVCVLVGMCEKLTLLHKGSYMSVPVYELRKSGKMRGLPSILSLFRNEFNKLNK